MNNAFIIDDYFDGVTDSSIPLPPQRKYKFDLLYCECLRTIRSDYRYQWMESHLHQGITIYYQIKNMIKHDPRYQYMKPYIEKALNVYSIISLITTISTMNPALIIISLYKMGA